MRKVIALKITQEHIDKGQTYHVAVTSEHIAKGRRRNNQWCPLALALRRHPSDRPEVGDLCIFANERQYKPGSAMIRFMREFDSGTPVKPGIYAMTLMR